jgi:polysaccharide export outer membrane protein
MIRTSLLFFLLTFWSALHAQQPTGGFAERDPRYRLQPSDVIELQYRYTPEYNQTVSIQPDGFVTLQLLGDMKLAGMTLDEAHAAVLKRASVRLHDPEVVLLLKDFEKAHFVVTGEVNTPGRYELHGKVTVLEAIAMAGGFKTASAKHSQVLLVHRVNDQLGETHVLNLKEIAKTQSFSEDRVIQPGDMVVVPQNTISKIERFVKWGNVGIYATPSIR